jgi:mannose-6-phosphate isomerase
MIPSLPLGQPDLMVPYSVGDSDERPWGSYVVLAAGVRNGEEYCEKRITINPNRILSLQSHDHRRETWIVEQGGLTVIIDGMQKELHAGDSISVTEGAIHCMANLSDEPCVVRERQMGICREEDIRRYIDAYGRSTELPASHTASKSITLYELILSDINRLAA